MNPARVSYFTGPSRGVPCHHSGLQEQTQVGVKRRRGRKGTAGWVPRAGIKDIDHAGGGSGGQSPADWIFESGKVPT